MAIGNGLMDVASSATCCRLSSVSPGGNLSRKRLDQCEGIFGSPYLSIKDLTGSVDFGSRMKLRPKMLREQLGIMLTTCFWCLKDCVLMPEVGWGRKDVLRYPCDILLSRRS